MSQSQGGQESVFAQEHRKLIGAADTYFGGFGAFTLLLTIIAWIKGDVTVRSPLLIALLPVYNLTLSQLSYRAKIPKVWTEIIRQASNAFLCPFVFFFLEPAVSPWWPCYIVFTLVGVIATGLTSKTRWTPRLLVLFWSVNLVTCALIFKTPIGFYQIAYLAGGIVMVGFVSIEWMHATRQAYEQVEGMRARSMQSAKMAALGEMAGGVAHEINSPLAIIKMNSETIGDLLGDESLDRQMLRERATTITDTVNRVAKIVLGLRALSQDEQGAPLSSESVSEVIENALARCREKLREKEIDVQVENMDPGLRVLCHPLEVSQVLLNLLNNAGDAVSGSEARPRWIRVRSEARGSQARISVMDSGSGVPKGLEEKIFQPFFTTKEIGKGMGLGLSTSKVSLESQNGSLKLDPDSRHTCFVIGLPIA